MRKAIILVHDQLAGTLEEVEPNRHYVFTYLPAYHGAPVSLTMPIANSRYVFDTFPPFFEGLLPEGMMLDGLLRRLKIDRNDFFAQLAATGEDLVGAVTFRMIPHE